MKIAEEFFLRAAEEGGIIEVLCGENCVEYEEFIIDGVNYITFAFLDQSSITFGNDGYIGVEH